ncbi:hypothetical protein P8625_09460 [Tenacibaculum tangerinum]|uniref:Riboflavin synthase subunit beta n=1 Tax=Tenacibaculum tangerinum TaxID=3038772 RepID=A0ABY8L2K9_9FLAO|nr:hypothetical protein [Tenacibaculum tangerinum]WGH74340.1 hypothetical protein P8625_09460 [Tenacibaculum tangerinum]
MAGEGHMNHVNSTLQKNKKDLLDRKRLFKNKQVYKDTTTGLKFEKISKEKLEEVKGKIRVKAKRDKKRFNLIMLFSAILVVSLLYYLFKDFSIDFTLFSRQR